MISFPPATKLRLTIALAAATLLSAALIAIPSGSVAGSPERLRAGSGVGGVTLTDLGDFDRPVYTQTAPGKANRNLLFVVEQGGLVRVIRRGRTLSQPFVDISEQISTGQEQGLLSITFPPDYAKSRRFYLYYTDAEGSITVSQMRASAESSVRAKPGRREVISIPHAQFPNHNGGQVSFGPDGNLWLATGDGGGACDPNENALNTQSLLGKLLRIDPRKRGGYTTPDGNPFVKRPGADEIYSLGLRNPFRFSFDEKTGTIAIGDVGQGTFEEIDLERVKAARGANFGWDAFEGRDAGVPGCGDDVTSPPPAGTEPPIFQYGHSGGEFSGCSITGGLIVRDRRLPTLAGRYLYSDVCNGELRSIVPALGGGSGDVALGLDVEAPTSFAAGRGGKVHVTSLAGDVFRLDPAARAIRAPATTSRRKPGDGRGGFRAVKIGNFDSPTYVTGPSGAGGLIFVVEQDGVIRQFKDGKVIGGKFLDIRSRVESGGERGLLSMAFSPNYAKSGIFYVYFTERGGDIVVQEYRRSGGNQRDAKEGSARTVIEVEHSQNSNHNGGQLQFGPDGNLYIATGDGGSAGDPPENAQDKGSLLGKLLRIDPRRSGNDPYTVPQDNPFVGGGGANEVYSYGLRNPYRFSFDRRGGEIVIGDVGQDSREEINFETLGSARGANFGWDAFEGKGPFDDPDASSTSIDHTPPIFDYSHSSGGCTVIGGYVSRDPGVRSLFGRLLYADLCEGQIRSLIPSLGGAKDDSKTGLPSSPGIATFGEDSRGRLYYANVSDGEVMAIRATRRGGKG